MQMACVAICKCHSEAVSSALPIKCALIVVQMACVATCKYHSKPMARVASCKCHYKTVASTYIDDGILIEMQLVCTATCKCRSRTVALPLIVKVYIDGCGSENRRHPPSTSLVIACKSSTALLFNRMAELPAGPKWVKIGSTMGCITFAPIGILFDHLSDPKRGNAKSRIATKSDSPCCKTKRSRLVRSDLTPEEEEAMVDWLREHPLLFNKRLSLYKDKGKKDALWAEQARKLGKEVVLLTVWYRSIRTRYGKLARPKSGAGTGDRTERDIWIMGKFDFLKSHIYEVRPRTFVSLKAKLAAQTPVDDDAESVDNDDNIQQLPSTSVPTSSQEEPKRHVILDVRPKRSSSRATAEEEMLLRTLDERGRQSMQLQEKLLDIIKPAARPSERATYGDWAKSVMEDLDPSLWRQFQQEQSQLLYKYLDLHDKVRSQPLQPQQHMWQPDQQQHCSSQQSSQSSQWQPPPQNWPTTVQTTSVWDSMSSTLVQAQMHPEPSLTTLQPRSRSTPQNPATSAAGSTTFSPRGEEVSSLSGIFNESFMQTFQCSDTSQ
ncbi:hypothetical protein MAR_015689 [Mya arenaria]|uniref:MADF domain-containing protein n=1 Tax=Mya arenaria TaxID=6604 RepID=A0ABY7FHR7_MYAAR|nr:hypothetical protein MAR_015689 [Mya arenaria]